MQSDGYLDTHYIGIRKESETDLYCTYLFICTHYRRGEGKRLESLGEVTGTFTIDKKDGAIELVKPMQGDERRRAYERAAYKIQKHWAAGTLPNSEVFCAG
jgi:hypothetical protein